MHMFDYAKDLRSRVTHDLSRLTLRAWAADTRAWVDAMDVALEEDATRAAWRAHGDVLQARLDALEPPHDTANRRSRSYIFERLTSLEAVNRPRFRGLTPTQRRLLGRLAAGWELAVDLRITPPQCGLHRGSTTEAVLVRTVVHLMERGLLHFVTHHGPIATYGVTPAAGCVQ
jgi:hypothetical protein